MTLHNSRLIIMSNGLPLDQYKNEIEFVYSQEKLISSCPNVWCEVRETGAETKQTFNFGDKTGILAFVGANSGYISGYMEQKTGVMTAIAETTQQQQIVNAGSWVDYTVKYNLELPLRTSLSVSGIAALNRLNHMDMHTYIGFKGQRQITGYLSDFIFIIKMLVNSENDFGWVALDNPFWYFRDGVTSELLNPAITCVPSGNDYCFGTNMIDTDIELNNHDTGANWVGDIKDLPRLIYYIAIGGSSGLTGDVKHLPPIKSFISMWGCVLVTGDVSNIPKVDTYFNAGSCALLTGLISNMPSVSGTFSVDGCALLTGVYAPLAVTNVMYFSWTNMSATDTDNVLIAIAAVTTVTGGTLYIKANRTAASDTAYTFLTVTKSWTVTEV